MASLEETFEVRKGEVARFEREYRLPPMIGTVRQCLWGRMIRRDFLGEVFSGLMDATECLAPRDAKDVFEVVDRLRGDAAASRWIEAYHPQSGRALAFVLERPAAEEEARQIIEEQTRKSIESRRLNKEAARFEQSLGLPPIRSRSASPRQENFARRCRYLMLRDLPSEEIVRLRLQIDMRVLADDWIAAHLRGQTVHEFTRLSRDAQRPEIPKQPPSE